MYNLPVDAPLILIFFSQFNLLHSIHFNAPGSHQLVIIIILLFILYYAFYSCIRLAVCLSMFFILKRIYTHYHLMSLFMFGTQTL